MVFLFVSYFAATHHYGNTRMGGRRGGGLDYIARPWRWVGFVRHALCYANVRRPGILFVVQQTCWAQGTRSTNL